MTDQLAYGIYKYLCKKAKKERKQILDKAIVHEGEAYYCEESGEVLQQLYTWSAIKAKALRYKASFKKPVEDQIKLLSNK